MSKNMTTILNSAERVTEQRNTELVRQRQELTSVADSLEGEFTTALGLPAQIRDDWKAGTDRPATDLVEAQANVERLETLLKGASSRESAVAAKIQTTDTRVAEALIPSVKHALPGVPVFATFATSKDWAQVPESLYPVAVIVQTGDSEHDTGSDYVAGPVEIHYFRTPTHRPIDLSKVEASQRAVGGSIKYRSATPQEPDQSHFVDVHPITAQGVRSSEVPTLESISTGAMEFLSQVVAAEFGIWADRGNKVTSTVPPLTKNGTGGWRYRFKAATVTSGGKWEHTETVEEGRRTVTVTETLGVEFHALVGSEATSALDNAARALVGKVRANLGLCTDASLRGGARDTANGPRIYSLRATFVSDLPV